MVELSLHRWLSWLELALAVPTLAALVWTTAPYGRHVREGWGPTVGNRLGWILMESPTVILFIALFCLGEHRAELVPLVFLGVWQLHYVHRTFIFPFRMRNSGKRMPLSIPILGASFQLLNVYINARWISHFGRYDTSWLSDPRFVLGVLVFGVGMGINLHADTVLIHLRKPGETGYRIPRGGMYRFVTSPNYLGEILEWCGWALMTWSLPGLAFAIYSVANLAPRAFSNHAWYREKFEDYPKTRKALIPFLL
ncbi:MAG: DUF1295 domain-containing protein [Sandaracinaceae bacterium]